jgi:hypothetical protein
MAVTAIHVVPDDNLDDRVVRDDIGHDLGHYPTRDDAGLAAQPIARELKTRFVVLLPDRRRSSTNFAKRWLARLFGS